MHSLGYRYPILLLVFLSAFSFQGWGQSDQDRRVEAINRYIDFSNECLHVLYAFREDLEELNKSMVLAIEQEESLVPAFNFSEYYRDDKFFTFLQGTCARTTQAIDAGLELRVLYGRTSNNQILTEQMRIRLNEYRDQIWYLMLEFLDKNYTLLTEVNRPRLRGDLFTDLFDRLDGISSVYLRIDDQISSFREYLETLPPLPEALRPFKSVADHGEALLHAVKTNDDAAIFASREALRQAISASKTARERNARDLRNLGISFEDDDEQAYDHAVEYGELLLRKTEPDILRSDVRRAWNRHAPSYNHFNRPLIDLYNHHKYGLTSYYKSLVNQADRRYPYPLDITPVFVVIYPEEEEEIEVVVVPPPVEEESEEEEEILTLEAAPTNNLVFLIDVSASMASSDKLPVLKENLEYLVSLFRPEDKIALVTFAGDASIVLEATPGIFPSEIKSAIRGIRTGGETKIKKGFREAYRIAEEEFIFNGTNRVILITDGIFQTDRSLESTISRGAGKGIQLSVMLLGRREAPQVRSRLSQLSDLGEGRYSHLKASTAKEVLVREARGE